jgi:hypothetical protein
MNRNKDGSALTNNKKNLPINSTVLQRKVNKNSQICQE